MQNVLDYVIFFCINVLYLQKHIIYLYTLLIIDIVLRFTIAKYGDHFHRAQNLFNDLRTNKRVTDFNYLFIYVNNYYTTHA